MRRSEDKKLGAVDPVGGQYSTRSIPTSPYMLLGMGNALIDVDPGAYMMGLQTGCLERLGSNKE
jgi:hypothetical protein